MDKEKFKPKTIEDNWAVVLGILLLYFLIVGFIFYLYCFHRINLTVLLVLVVLFTILYFPRFLIIYKLKKMSNIKIIEDFVLINDVGIGLNDIESFAVRQKKAQVIFFINNKMVVYNEADFVIKTEFEDISFTINGEEKITLVKNFLSEVVKNNKN